VITTGGPPLTCGQWSAEGINISRETFLGLNQELNPRSLASYTSMQNRYTIQIQVR
jgi:hypothetical protein